MNTNHRSQYKKLHKLFHNLQCKKVPSAAQCSSIFIITEKISCIQNINAPGSIDPGAERRFTIERSGKYLINLSLTFSTKVLIFNVSLNGQISMQFIKNFMLKIIFLNIVGMKLSKNKKFGIKNAKIVAEK